MPFLVACTGTYQGVVVAGLGGVTDGGRLVGAGLRLKGGAHVNAVVGAEVDVDQPAGDGADQGGDQAGAGKAGPDYLLPLLVGNLLAINLF